MESLYGGLLSLKELSIQSVSELETFLKQRKPALFCGSKTSTVIPFDHLESGTNELVLVNLAKLPKKLRLNEKGNLVISGPVTWEEAREFLHGKGLEMPLWPTEQTAQVLAGLATSATGERSFSQGNLRKHVHQVEFMDPEGHIRVFSGHRPVEGVFSPGDCLSAYQHAYTAYKNFKNAPFPRLEVETDLLIGTEGQLGVLLEVELGVISKEITQFLGIWLPSWREDWKYHTQLVSKLNSLRGPILSCELLDFESLSFGEFERFPVGGKDLLLLEVVESSIEEIFEYISTQVPTLNPESVVQISSEEANSIRVQVPRKINEYLSKNHMKKQGTDTQVSINQLSYLFERYKEMANKGFRTILFGHIGDAHLHFNFLMAPDQVDAVKEELDIFYRELSLQSASPFAEHGIGLIKQSWIKNFLSDFHFKVFHELKKKFDPHNQFFPKGFFSMVNHER